MTCKIITTLIPDRSDDRYGWCKTKETTEENNCGICGDWHEEENVPLSCQTGDGE